jgi:hypothetical protein
LFNSGIYFKKPQEDHILTQLCSTVKFMHWLWQKWVGRHFGRFFHKLIWSPCFRVWSIAW